VVEVDVAVVVAAAVAVAVAVEVGDSGVNLVRIEAERATMVRLASVETARCRQGWERWTRKRTWPLLAPMKQ
jgi:hypothetical protein